MEEKGNIGAEDEGTLGYGHVSTGKALDGCPASNQLHFVYAQGKRGYC